MTYVDGFVAAVPTANKDKYLQHAKDAAEVFQDYGALKLVECWGDDVPKGERTDFYRAVDAKEDETIVLSWVVWPDKATRDQGMEKLMSDPRMADESNPMPFDASRLIYGGFDMILEI